MDAAPERIKDMLEQQVSGYRELLDLLQKERRRLIDLDWEAIKELSKQKDTVVLKLRLLEEERVRLTEGFCFDGHDGTSLSLRELEARTGDPAFRTLRSRLLCLLQSISELNEFNRILIDRSLSVVNGSLEAIGMGRKGFLPAKGAAQILSRDI